MLGSWVPEETSGSKNCRIWSISTFAVAALICFKNLFLAKIEHDCIFCCKNLTWRRRVAERIAASLFCLDLLVSFRMVLYRSVLFCIVLYRSVSFCIVPYCFVSLSIVECCFTSWNDSSLAPESRLFQNWGWKLSWKCHHDKFVGLLKRKNIDLQVTNIESTTGHVSSVL